MRCRLIAVSPMRILQASSRVLEEAPRRLRSGTSFAFAPLLDLRGIQSPPFPPPNVGESVRVVQHHLTELHECSRAPDFPFRRASAKVALGWWTARGPRRYRGESSPFGLSMLLRRTTSVGLLQCTPWGVDFRMPTPSLRLSVPRDSWESLVNFNLRLRVTTRLGVLLSA